MMFIVKYLHDVLYLYSYLYVLLLATTVVLIEAGSLNTSRGFDSIVLIQAVSFC